MKPSHSMGTIVSLITYSEQFEAQMKQYYLSESQLEFTGRPIDKIQNRELSPQPYHTLILEGDRVVGYFALEGGEKRSRYSENASARLLTSFSIAHDEQGKGYAKQALSLLRDHVKHAYPEIDEIVLGVNKRNIPAYTLYVKSGFEDHGEIFEGKKGPQHILHLAL